MSYVEQYGRYSWGPTHNWYILEKSVTFDPDRFMVWSVERTDKDAAEKVKNRHKAVVLSYDEYMEWYHDGCGGNPAIYAKEFANYENPAN